MPEPQELEGKFSGEREALDRVLALRQIGDFQLTRRSERIQTDIYFDTEDLRLRRQSCSLRVRSVGERQKATFKGPRQAVDAAEDAAHLVARLEIEVDVVPSANPETPFVERLDLEPVNRARHLIGPDDDLHPIAHLVTHRRMLHYERGADEIVELSLDDVEAVDLRNDERSHIIEIEVELIEGAAQTLVDAAGSLRDEVPTLRPSIDSKLARTLGQTSQPAEAAD